MSTQTCVIPPRVNVKASGPARGCGASRRPANGGRLGIGYWRGSRYGAWVRWKPTDEVCPECGFDWSTGRNDCVVIVRQAPDGAAAAIDSITDPTEQHGSRWSPSMYVWHLVDVLRIGAERLITIKLDPAHGIPCWDENLLAEARRYRQLSVSAGVKALANASRQWLEAVDYTPETTVEHPVFGTLTTLDVIRRTAHEVQHHLWDIEPSRNTTT